MSHKRTNLANKKAKIGQNGLETHQILLPLEYVLKSEVTGIYLKKYFTIFTHYLMINQWVKQVLLITHFFTHLLNNGSSKYLANLRGCAKGEIYWMKYQLHNGSFFCLALG